MSPPNESTVACYTPAGNGAIAPRPPPTAGATQKRRSVLRFAKLQSDRLLGGRKGRPSPLLSLHTGMSAFPGVRDGRILESTGRVGCHEKHSAPKRWSLGSISTRP